jgi:hypothetical protein
MRTRDVPPRHGISGVDRKDTGVEKESFAGVAADDNGVIRGAGGQRHKSEPQQRPECERENIHFFSPFVVSEWLHRGWPHAVVLVLENVAVEHPLSGHALPRLDRHRLT